MSSLTPRVVLVTRESDFELLLAHHATRGQAAFYLEQRGQKLALAEARHLRLQQSLHDIRSAIPDDWRSAHVNRGELDRFLFAPEDIIVAVGQDGLVANVAKYLNGQPVIGVNPEPDINEGILVPFRVENMSAALRAAPSGAWPTERRTMAEAILDDGRRLVGLNEIFIGHVSHQSARYEIAFGNMHENHSSSGIIVATGTGATGWARSIRQQSSLVETIAPTPTDLALEFMVREAWPSRYTQATLVDGLIQQSESLRITSRMNENGVIFADGMETDRLIFGWGQSLEIRISERRLTLLLNNQK
jgi:NAD kinase